MKRISFSFLNTPGVNGWHWLLFTVILALGFFTLNISPLPWYDEVDFASITHSYSENKTFVCTANDLYFPARGTEVLYYGPVYFVLTGVITKLVGFGVFQFRLLNFVSGIVCVYLFIKLFERLSGRPLTQVSKLVIALLMVSDYTYMQDMHSGRMDLLALMLVLIGLLLANSSSRRVWLNFSLSGLFIAAALLTTPRVYFIVLPYFGYLLYIYFKTRQQKILGGILCAGSVTCIIYLLWIFMKFGSIQGFINYFTTPTTYFTSAAGYFFMLNTAIPAYQAIGYILLLLLAGFIALKDVKTLLQPESIVPLITIFLFLGLVGGSVVYMSFITGFVYLLILNFSGRLKRGKEALIVLLLMVNFGLAGYKYFIVFSNYPDRNPKQLSQWIQKTIPMGSKVVADDKYFYAVINDQAQFQYLFRGGTDAQRAIYHNDQWKADYLLTEDTGRAVFAEYRKHAKLELLDEYKTGDRMGSMGEITGSYHGFLFRFLR